MSMSKRLLFDRRPEDDVTRARMREGAALHEFTFSIGTRRLNSRKPPYWCPRWRGALDKAVRELGVECRHVNEKVCFRTLEDREAILKRAEALYSERVKSHKPRFSLD